MSKKSKKEPKKSILPLRRDSDLHPSDVENAKKKSKEEKKIPFRRKSDLKRAEKLEDNDLIELVRSEYPYLYQILIERYHKKLFSYVCHLMGSRYSKEEVEDLMQNIFVKVFNNLDKFDTDRKFSSWIYRISHNEAVNFIKRKSKRKLVSWEDISTSKDKLEINMSEETTEKGVIDKEISKEVDDALEKLPEKYKKVLSLRYFNELSYDKIGKIIGKPVNTVGTLINRAKKKLYDIVEEDKKK